MAPTLADLAGLRVLVIEDESMVSMMLEDLLTEIGCEVIGIASHFDDATAKARSMVFDIAILDINLHGRQTFSIADLLAERGIAFVVSTGYAGAGLPASVQRAPVLQKPFRQRDLARAVQAALK